MGVIVAAPTAGGAGVLPGTLLGIARRHPVTEEAMVRALATAGLIGAVVAVRASLSGAEGGCQAETGAAAMLMAAPKAKAREAADIVLFMVYLLDGLDIFRFIAGEGNHICACYRGSRRASEFLTK